MNWKLHAAAVTILVVLGLGIWAVVADDRNVTRNSIGIYEQDVDNLSTLLNGGTVSSKDYENLLWISNTTANRNKDEFGEALKRKGRTWDDLREVLEKRISVQ